MESEQTRTAAARAAVRELMPFEADLAFRRRCETVVEFLDAGPGDLILDCGTGYGFYLRLLSELSKASIVGIDPERERLLVAQNRLGERPRLTYVQGSAETLPFADGHFSGIICSEVLEHLVDDAGAAAELYRVLQPGGVLVVTVPSADYPFAWDPINFLLERATGRHIGGERVFSGIWYGHRRLYTMATLCTLLENAGFVVEERRPLTHFCPPFAHLVLYGLLKPLLLSGRLPSAFARAGDRYGNPAPERPTLVALAARLLNALDRRNDAPDLARRKQTFVALAVRARRPT
ncbi:MAG: methyltransferase domain-containing protein [Chloroflexia bacterium]|nr:methyltransferase domain-containing protein [Chloroflexia bacterium]